jgi:hypothetical protein
MYSGMEECFGSTCHGAGRAQSRNKSRRNLSYQEVLDKLASQGIAIRVASPKLVMEEAPESYKDVCAVRIFRQGVMQVHVTERVNLSYWYRLWTLVTRPAYQTNASNYDLLPSLRGNYCAYN